MTYENLGRSALNYFPCRYGRSKLLFRGPKRELEGNYAAFLGSTETYGKFIPRPFPALTEERLGMRCVNFGWPNAGVDVFLNEPEVLKTAQRASVTVIQIPAAQNLSNRFYSVHPRRNDRFLEASGLLRTMFREVDFTDFHFTRHMLQNLRQVSDERFGMVRDEIQNAWRSRMRLLLSRVGKPVVLLWFSAHAPARHADAPELAEDPSFVTEDMIDSVRPLVSGVVEVVASDRAKTAGTDGMVFAPTETAAAAELLGPLAHEEAVEALVPVLRGCIVSK